MPMMSGPLSALAYTAVKVIGYAAFARVLNKVAAGPVRPLRFGAWLTGFGLAGGVFYLFFLAPSMGLRLQSDWLLFAFALPTRLLVWTLTLAMLYGFRRQPQLMLAAVLGGASWSYALDGVMWLVYRLIPGVVMPLC